VSQFADAEIMVTSGDLENTRWQTDYAPYQRGIMDAFHERGVQVVVVMGSSQWGKSSCAINVICYHVKHDPCHILNVQPTIEMAEEFSKTRLSRTFEASPALAAIIGKPRARDASNTVRGKHFPGGSLALAGANSAASLAARSVRLLVLDEVDRYPVELPGEGDPIAVAIKRTTAYKRRRRILMVSSPTMETAPIHGWFKRGDQRHYQVPCPSCGVLFAYRWQHIRWTDDDPQTARIHCPTCDHGLDEVQRVAVLRHGQWVAEHPHRRDQSIVSFHMWEAYSPLSSLAKIVSDFLHARADQKRDDDRAMHSWINTCLGEPLKPVGGERVETHTLAGKREAYAAPVPAGACLLTMAVDVQDDRLEVLVMGWGPGQESWFIDHQRLDGDTSQEDVWSALEDMLDVTYQHESGAMLAPQATCIDSAGHRTTQVYNFVAAHPARRLHAIIGRDGKRVLVGPPSPRRWGKDRRKVNLYTVGVDTAKSTWMRRLKSTVVGPGAVHFPMADWCDDEFFEQLTAEQLVVRYVRGVRLESWQKIRARNEVLDLAVYSLAALELVRPRPDFAKLAARLADGAQPSRPIAPKPPAPTRPDSAPTPKQPWIPRREGWLKRR
jgi:phage terminase large subunit GpA-like protein